MSEHQPNPDSTAEQVQSPESQSDETHDSSEQAPRGGFFDRLRDIDMRRTQDGWIGGVAAGLAHRLGLDPLVVRAGFIVLGLIFGLGAALYVLAWVFIPDTDESTHADRGLRGGSIASIFLLVLTALVVLGSLPFWGIGGGDSFGGAIFGLIVLTGLGYAFYRAWTGRAVPGTVGRDGSAQRYAASGQAPPPPPPGGPTADSTGFNPTPPSGPPAPQRGRRLSGGGPLAALTAGALLIIVAGLTWTGDSLNVGGNPLTVAWCVALAVVAVLLVALGFAGRRAGWVGFFGLIAVLATLLTAPLPADLRWNSSTGDVEHIPTSAAALQDIDLGAGQVELDLTVLNARTLDSDTSRIDVGLGQVVIVVPTDLSVEIDSDIGAGELLIDGDPFDRSGTPGRSPEVTINADDGTTQTLAAGTTFSDDGTDVQTRALIGSQPADLVIEVEVGLGQVRVMTQERD